MNDRDSRVLVALFVFAIAIGSVVGYLLGLVGGHLVVWRS